MAILLAIGIASIILAIIYILFPVDFIPDFIPFAGQIDDFLIGGSLFIIGIFLSYLYVSRELAKVDKFVLIWSAVILLLVFFIILAFKREKKGGRKWKTTRRTY